MNTSCGFDRISTEEELHQVLDVLGELAHHGYVLSTDASSSQSSELWADSLLDDGADAESLLEMIQRRPELKN